MREFRVRPVDRFQVTSHNDMHPDIGVETVATNLTESEANNLAGAMFARSHAEGVVCRVVYASGQTMDSETEPRPREERLLGAIDKLALALTEHGHQWTADERLAYEMAVGDIGKAKVDTLKIATESVTAVIGGHIYIRQEFLEEAGIKTGDLIK